MFRVAVIGASGLLGRAVVRELAAVTAWQLVPTAFRHGGPQQAVLDVRDAQAVDAFVEREAPDAIVLAAAERHPDVCEHDPAAARALNVDAVRSVATAARRRGAWVLSISTDYVFDGNKGAPYVESDLTTPLGVYGASKLAGEQAVLEANSRTSVLRTSWLVSQRGNNFVRTMIKAGRKTDRLRVVADQRGCPTSAT
ncbi:MAG: SDR family oxidoreductase, partial [Paraburkholderia sp.]|nr:SDR family oxidoreductase [Paraburkholderia sp.]